MILTLGSRADQQDCFGYALKEQDGLFVICDGMGGYEGGALSAQLAMRRMLQEYPETEPDMDPDRYLQTTAEKANLDICRLTDENGHHYKTGTTMVSVIIKDRMLHWCSVGDSRAYLLRGGKFAQITQDHTYETVLTGQRNAGQISERQYRELLPHKDLLISFLGVGKDLLMDYNVRPFALETGDRVLLASDGLYKTLDEKTIFDIISGSSGQEEALDALEQAAQQTAAKERHSRDNLSAILIKMI